MSNELFLPSIPGVNIYGLLIRRSDMFIWNSITFEAENSANLGNYQITLTDPNGLGIYRANLPIIADGLYDIIYKLKISGSPALDDPITGQQSLDLKSNIDITLNSLRLVSDKLNTTLETSGSNYKFTVDALSNGAAGTTSFSIDEVKQIRSALGIDGIKTTAVGGQLQQILNVVVGPGNTSVTLETLKSDNTPIEGAEVWVSTDTAGTNIIAGIQRTNVFGEVVFLLNPGFYYRWARKSGLQFANPIGFTVV